RPKPGFLPVSSARPRQLYTGYAKRDFQSDIKR
ncbi:hypothetical protein, partial [Klebsiella pneumoniae]